MLLALFSNWTWIPKSGIPLYVLDFFHIQKSNIIKISVTKMLYQSGQKLGAVIFVEVILCVESGALILSGRILASDLLKCKSS